MSITNLDFTDEKMMLDAIDDSANYIKAKIPKIPEIALVLGSGLSEYAHQLSNACIIDYAEIPYFQSPTVSGHGGRLIIGEIAGKSVLVMQGRYHYYEGFDTQTITFPIRVFAKLGIQSLILTNACGGVNKHFKPGDIMIIEDHISLFCPSPLRGAALESLGPRFTDMSQAYCPEYIALAESCAKDLNIPVQKGVYAYWTGPTYETAAEIRAYMALGADVVGMSTVPETAVAVNAGMKVLGISCVTNMTCLISKSVTSHEEVIEMGKKVAASFTQLVTKILENI